MENPSTLPIPFLSVDEVCETLSGLLGSDQDPAVQIETPSSPKNLIPRGTRPIQSVHPGATRHLKLSNFQGVSSIWAEWTRAVKNDEESRPLDTSPLFHKLKIYSHKGVVCISQTLKRERKKSPRMLRPMSAGLLLWLETESKDE